MLLPQIVEVSFFNSQIVNKNVKNSQNRETVLFEIELPVEAGGISYIDDTLKAIDSNMIICAKPGQIRHTRFPFKCYYVHISVEKGPLYDILMSTPNFFETDKHEFYKEIFVKMVQHYGSLNENEEIILQSLLLELIYTIGKDSKNKKGSLTENHLTIEKSINYINEHLTENLSLEKISKEMSFSPIYFHNTFKATVGKTLRDYIEEQRIKKAENLLLTTKYSLTQIAYECGFSSQSYFSYVFKRRMKKTPREYAKEIYHKYEM